MRKDNESTKYKVCGQIMLSILELDLMQLQENIKNKFDSRYKDVCEIISHIALYI